MALDEHPERAFYQPSVPTAEPPQLNAPNRVASTAEAVSQLGRPGPRSRRGQGGLLPGPPATWCRFLFSKGHRGGGLGSRPCDLIYSQMPLSGPRLQDSHIVGYGFCI